MAGIAPVLVGFCRATMTILSASNLGMEFTGTYCFQGVNFALSAGARVGLIGANGTGKTTLLKIIRGAIEHEGTMSLRKGLRLAFLEQNTTLDPSWTVRDAVLSAAEELQGIQEKREKIHHDLSLPESRTDGHEKLLKRLAVLDQQFESVGGYSLQHRAEKILEGIGFPPSRWDQKVDSLSGGEVNRLAIGRLLLLEPDVFLLDEPSNHLDLEGVAFLTEFLRESSAASILVSHDRRFLDETTTETWEMEGKRMWIYPASYSRAKVLREERLKSAVRAFDKEDKDLKRQEAFIRRYKAGQRARQAKGRQKRLDRVDRLKNPREQVRSMILQFPMKEPPGSRILEVENLSMGFEDRTLFEDLSFELTPGETIGIVGANGSGKTTLLRLLQDQLAPRKGTMKWGGRISKGTLSQHEVFPHPDTTPLEFLRVASDILTMQELRDILGAMLFRGKEIEKPVRVLSGGEQKRLMMTRLLLEGNNVLLLDEPTNHLDLVSREAVEFALSSYLGTVIVVSHDRYFLDQIADRVLWLEQDEWHLSYGGFREANDARRARLAARAADRVVRKKVLKKKSVKRPARSRFSKLETVEVEAKIIECEEKVWNLQLAMGKREISSDPAKLQDLQRQINGLETERAALEAEYESRGE